MTDTETSTGPYGPPGADPTVAELLQVSDVHKGYRDGASEQRILDGVSFEIERGGCVALLGRSGSGKSTLLNLIAGIDRPDRGTISFLGQPLSSLREPALTLLRRRHVGFIYQFFNLLPTLTVAENLSLPLELNGYPHAVAAPRVERLLNRLALGRRRDAFPDQLSGGEQQRVAIGRALIHEPALVLADEPTGNLDAETGTQILELLAELFRDRRQSLILVTHSLAVSRIADRVLTLENGRLAGSGSRLSW